MNNIVGKTFGRWTVLNDGTQKNKVYCRCSCGVEKEVNKNNLINGKTLSCGCLRKENQSLNLLNKHFGLLTPIEKTNKRSASRGNIWRCKCKCGNELLVATNDLTRGHIQSCGCLKSQGENKIEKILLDNKIKFKREYTFSGLTGERGVSLRFDFGILDNENNLQYLIEYDGIQHFIAKGGWNTFENLEKTQYRDQIKNQWCIKNNIPLIRIPYNHLKKLSIEDLLLKTSYFIYSIEEVK